MSDSTHVCRHPSSWEGAVPQYKPVHAQYLTKLGFPNVRQTRNWHEQGDINLLIFISLSITDLNEAFLLSFNAGLFEQHSPIAARMLG